MGSGLALLWGDELRRTPYVHGFCCVAQIVYVWADRLYYLMVPLFQYINFNEIHIYVCSMFVCISYLHTLALGTIHFTITTFHVS